MRLIDYFDRGAERYPKRACLVEGEESSDFAQVSARSHQIARALTGDGLKPGAKAGVYSPNSARLLECLLGVLRAGLVWVPLNARATIDEIAHVVTLVACDVIFFDAKFAANVEALRPRCDPRTRFICISDAGGWQEFLAGHEGVFADLPSAPDDIAAIFSTGGTTGLPKGVVWTNRVFETMVANFFASFPVKSAPVHLAAAPLTHAAGVIALMLLAEGGTQVILPSADAGAIVNAIARHRVTHLFLPPTVIYAMLSHPLVRDGDYASLNYFIYSAAPMSVEKLKEAIGVFGPVMAQAFGQVEAPLMCTALTPSEHVLGDPALEKRLASCGRPGLLTRVAIMDDDQNLLGENRRGEIVVRGNLVMAGYYQDGESTRQASLGGWHHTGDIGYRDEHGYYFIVDRKKDMIISGGFNVYPSEIEQVLWAHPAVQDCAVIGVPDEKWGEAVKAIVELKPGASTDDGELMRHCKEKLGSIKAPKSVEIWPSLPRTAVGKVRKADIRATFWAGRSRFV